MHGHKIIQKVVPKLQMSRVRQGSFMTSFCLILLSACICTSNSYDLARFKAIWIPWSEAQPLKPNYFTLLTQDSEIEALNIKPACHYLLSFSACPTFYIILNVYGL